MQDAKIVAYCSSCETPIVFGMKLNTYPCSDPAHADCYEVYCQSLVQQRKQQRHGERARV